MPPYDGEQSLLDDERAPAHLDERHPHTMTQLTPARTRLALLALALGGFGIGTTEFVAMGLLPDIARDLLPGL